MYMSKERLTGNEKAKFILIEDSVESCGRRLFKALIKLFLREGENMFVICYHGSQESLYSDINLPADQVTFLDAFSDPLNWKETNEPSCNFMSPESIEIVSSGKGIVCIDSLTTMCLHTGVNELYRSLHILLQKNRNLQLLALLHSDVHKIEECGILRNLSSTVLDIRSASNDDSLVLCTEKYFHCKLSQNYFEYKIEDDFNVVFKDLPAKQTKENSAVTKQPDPTAHLTFNLKLKDDEKEVRKQLQLPYMKMQESNAVINLLEEDFYEEDDPDDDLIL